MDNKNSLNQDFLNSFHHSYASDAYNFLGSFHNDKETLFRVYAPHATTVSVVGDFNSWDISKHPMHKVDEGGIWETTIPGIKIYDNYKYAIYNEKAQKRVLKQDPYGYHFETNELLELILQPAIGADSLNRKF